MMEGIGGKDSTSISDGFSVDDGGRQRFLLPSRNNANTVATATWHAMQLQ